MKLIKTKNFEGYDIKEVHKFMKKKGWFKKWDEWYFMGPNKVSKEDFDNFIKDEPNMDKEALQK